MHLPERQCKNWLDSFMLWTKGLEPPQSFRKWVGISAIASALRRKCKLDWGFTTFYPNFYIILVAPPGKARKGTAIQAGTRLITKLGIPLAPNTTTKQALIRRLCECSCHVANLTADSPVIKPHSSLTVVIPELTTFLGYDDADFMTALTDWFDCANVWKYETIARKEEEILGVWVNLLGATTPGLMQTAMPRTAASSGFTSRVIFVYEDRKGKTAPMQFFTEEELQLEENLQQDLRTISLLRGDFKPSLAFLDLYTNWYIMNSEKNVFDVEFMAPYCERRQVHLLKLAMIMSAARGNDMLLTELDFNRALQELLAVEKKMPLAFQGVGRRQDADVLANIMSDIRVKRKTTLRDLMRTYITDIDRETLGKILVSLEEMGFCKMVNKDGVVEITHTPDSTGKSIMQNE